MTTLGWRRSLEEAPAFMRKVAAGPRPAYLALLREALSDPSFDGPCGPGCGVLIGCFREWCPAQAELRCAGPPSPTSGSRARA